MKFAIVKIKDRLLSKYDIRKPLNIPKNIDRKIAETKEIFFILLSPISY